MAIYTKISSKDIQSIESVSNELIDLIGQIQILNNRIEQEIEKAESQEEPVDTLQKLLVAIPRKIAGLDKINSFSVEEINLQMYQDDLENHLNQFFQKSNIVPVF